MAVIVVASATCLETLLCLLVIGGHCWLVACEPCRRLVTLTLVHWCPGQLSPVKSLHLSVRSVSSSADRVPKYQFPRDCVIEHSSPSPHLETSWKCKTGTGTSRLQRSMIGLVWFGCRSTSLAQVLPHKCTNSPRQEFAIAVSFPQGEFRSCARTL